MSIDTLSILGANLLATFGKNTAVTVRHNYGQKELTVLSARTGNVIATIAVDAVFDGQYWPTLNLDYNGVNYFNTEELGYAIMESKKFPRNRKMNKAWSPIRFSAASKAMMEADSGIRFN